MKKWKCTACGYEFSGEAQPEKCPACGAGEERIEAVEQENKAADEKEKTSAAETKKENGESSGKRWRCTICNYIHIGPEPPDECPVCGADKSYFVEVTDEEPAGADKPGEAKEPDSKPKAPAEERKKSVEGKEKKKKKKPFGMLGGLVVRLHLHPISVHIPNGVLPLAVVFLALAMFFQYWLLEWASLFNYIAVFLSIPVVFATGYISWQRKYNGARTWIFKTKLTCTAIVAVLVSLIVLWRFIDPGIAHSSGIGGWTYLGLGVAAMVAAVIAGYMGGKLVFKNG